MPKAVNTVVNHTRKEQASTIFNSLLFRSCVLKFQSPPQCFQALIPALDTRGNIVPGTSPVVPWVVAEIADTRVGNRKPALTSARSTVGTVQS